MLSILFGYMQVEATFPEPAVWWLLAVGAVAVAFKFLRGPKA